MHNRSRARRNDSLKFAVPAILGAGAILVAGGIAVAQNNTHETRACTVTGKDMTHEAGTKNTAGRNIYQVYTSDCGTMRVEDNMFQGVWNSADLYGSLMPGQRYTITTVGWRIPWASQFPTITKVEPKP